MFDFKSLMATGKAKGKEVMKRGVEYGGATALIAGGMIVSSHVFSFKKLFKNAPADAWYIKHEGALKLGLGVGALALFGHKMQPWMKWLVIGVAVHGAIVAARQYTTNEAGVAMFDPIGRSSTDEEMEAAARRVAGDSGSSVAGNEQTLDLDTGSSSVAGFGSYGGWGGGNGIPVRFAA